MGSSTKASDWKVGMIGELAAEGNVLWAFNFASEDAGFSGDFVFAGVGRGGGVMISKGSEKPSEITCSRSFSAKDLDMTPGVITTAGVSIIVGGGIAVISA